MAALASRLLLVVLLSVASVNSDFLFNELNPSQGSIEACAAECLKKVGSDTNNVDTSSSCSRGCRFFALVQMIDSGKFLDRDSILDTCKSACRQGYGDKNPDSSGCAMGCQLLIPPIPVVAEFSWSLIVDSGNAMQILQGDIPDDVLTDPGLRSQVSKMDRLPEMRVRTLPVSQVKDEGVVGWWGSCGSGRGVPHCLAASLLLLLILVALWFGLSLEEPRASPGATEPDETASCAKKRPPPHCVQHRIVRDDDVMYEAPPLQSKIPLV